MKSNNAPRTVAYGRTFAALLVMLILLSISCEKKAAPPPVDESRSRLSAGRQIEGFAARGSGAGGGGGGGGGGVLP